jgi:hypothetical protein
MESELKNSEYYVNQKAGNKAGFSTPATYFDSLEKEIAAKISEEKFKKETAFKVPENYFNNIETSVLTKVLSTEKKTKVISFKARILKIAPLVAAASIILFIGINSFIFNTEEALTLDSLSNNDFEYWLEANTLNTNDITSILGDDILDENEFYFTNLKDESIEEYINSLDNNALWNEIN